MIINPRRKARAGLSPLRTQDEVEQATMVADAWRERRTAVLVEAGREADLSTGEEYQGYGSSARVPF